MTVRLPRDFTLHLRAAGITVTGTQHPDNTVTIHGAHDDIPYRNLAEVVRGDRGAVIEWHTTAQEQQ